MRYSTISIVFTFLLLTGCTPSLPTTNHSTQFSDSRPEVKERLVWFRSNGKPVFDRFRIVQFYQSGDGYKKGLARTLNNVYAELNDEIAQMYTYQWVAEKFQGHYPERVQKNDLAFYSIYAMDRDIKNAKDLINKAHELESHYPGKTITVNMISEPLPFEDHTLSFTDSKIVIRQSVDTIYKLKGQPFTTYSLNAWNLFQVIKGEKEYGTAGYFKIDSKTQKVNIKSLNNKLRINKEHTNTIGNKYTFTKAGTAGIRFSVAGQQKDMFIEVIELPVKAHSKLDSLIKTLGLPDQKKVYYTSWPCSRSVNGFFYKPSASDSSIRTQHWMYNAYPNMVLEIQGDTVTDVSNIRSNKLYPNSFTDEC
ncbi:hypothetical protein WNY58_16305 [Neptuniibacter pectenicola]|uniref:Uncharacterized protein n=1 Tax=Neptuniibacter pectenicola TaxID=1806669 RepID=A0ABU9TWV0_9GAMM